MAVTVSAREETMAIAYPSGSSMNAAIEAHEATWKQE